MSKETADSDYKTCETSSSKPRRKFLKQAALSATGAVTFVKATASSAEGESALPAIISLLLEDNQGDATLAPALGETLTIDPVEGEEIQQVLQAPLGAQFVQVMAQGAGGGGSVAGTQEGASEAASGGDGGRVSALLKLDGLGSTLIAQVGTGGSPADSQFGQGGQFGGGDGGDIVGDFDEDSGRKGAGGGGHSALLDAEGRVVLFAGGGGGAGGALVFEGFTPGGAGGHAGAFQDANIRAGEDGDLPLSTNGGGLGGNRTVEGGTISSVSTSLGGRGQEDGFDGFGVNGGNGGRFTSGVGFSQNSNGAGGGGGSGFTISSFGRNIGAGAGGGSSRSVDAFLPRSGGGGAGGANFVDDTAVVDLAFSGRLVDSGGSVGEAGVPAKLAVTFFREAPFE